MFSKRNFTKIFVVLTLLAVLCSHAAARVKVIHVDADAPVGTNDGSNWENAYLCLQDALADSEPNDEIRVANGTYKPDHRTTYGRDRGPEITASGDWTETFELIDGITLKGSYAGYGARNPYARDTDLYETILSGDLYDNDTDVDNSDYPEESSRAENSYHVVYNNGRRDVTIDGFTITGGNANESSDDYSRGGGLYNRYGTMRINNCTFSANYALFSGGGIYNYQGTLSLTNCTFARNIAGSTGGGGIYNYKGNPSLTNCRFIENITRSGDGGGIYNDESDTKLDNCTFIENAANNGGGLYNRYSSPTIFNCKFLENGAGSGGGMYNFNRSQNRPILRNCLFNKNGARLLGGGIYNYWGEPLLTNCTFVWNSAREDGRALACRSDHERNIVTLTNCILWDFGHEIWNDDLSIINVSYSNIQGGWFGEGNIEENPQFVHTFGPDYILGTEDDDLRLSVTSPCIDSGDPNYVLEPNETDLEGYRRIVNDRVDMGAYEFRGIIYVDDDAPYNSEPEISSYIPGYGTKDYPCETIQEAIDIASDGYIILVMPGVYDKIDFKGKAIIVAGTAGAVIEAWHESIKGPIEEDAVTFHTGERPGSVLKNFIIRNSATAISLNYGSSPTLHNLTIVDNDFGIAAYENSNPDIRNCILWNNRNGDLFQCEARYSCIENGIRGEGNINVNPLFVDAANGDYHLKSEGWRWNMDSESWTWDNVTSRCIDAGDPTFPLGNEPMEVPRDPDNLFGINRQINMGAYGGTSQASMPPLDWPPAGEDRTPPTPNPAQWAPDGTPRECQISRPLEYWIEMKAEPAVDTSGLVEYFFECTTNSDYNSGWQSSPNYTVSDVRSGQDLRFRVKARDLYGNETAWSAEMPARRP